MNDHYEDILYHAAEETLESLAFMFIEPGDTRNPKDYSGAEAVSMYFSGPFSGQLVLTCSDQVLPELAENMLGTEEDIPLSQQRDALKELLNVICGNTLPAIAGKEAVFDLTMPEVLPKEEREGFPDGREPAATVRFEVDEGLGELLLFVDGHVPGERAER
jgi:CheY-specific phosphatase CheX